jgi:hypothetical protein
MMGSGETEYRRQLTVNNGKPTLTIKSKEDPSAFYDILLLGVLPQESPKIVRKRISRRDETLYLSARNTLYNPGSKRN